jgi:hypothetical protein
MRLMKHFLAAALVALLFACSGTNTLLSPDGGVLGDGGNGESCKSAQPASQGASQPCCKDWGPDACGAALFCAAFDGRTQTTCYPDHSRLDGESCSADTQCLHNVCDGTCTGPAVLPPVLPPADDAGADPPGPPGKCPSTCTTNAQCESTCPPVPGGGSQCCDTFTGVCYGSKTPTCPGG